MSVILHRSSLTLLYNEQHLAINHSETRAKEGMTPLISMPFGSSRGHRRAGSYLTNLCFFGLDFPVESGTVNTDFLNEWVPSGKQVGLL